MLAALAQAGDDWSHGYDLCRSLDLRAGTVYPILIRLADRGLVETSWETDPPRGRPARHLYRLSTAGVEFARAEGVAARTADVSVPAVARLAPKTV
ncbi:PadR family transcriptional regulator [Micromonospora sp. HUAS YX12]|uniref:PadR family transcriptional regulator n=1 Tax=Micromonospora sp. HUAS YX12 TaxID=3156396 RepID=A0AAU7R833_9ACTN